MTLNALAGGGQRAAGAGRPRAFKDPKKSSLSRRGNSVIALSTSRTGSAARTSWPVSSPHSVQGVGYGHTSSASGAFAVPTLNLNALRW